MPIQKSYLNHHLTALQLTSKTTEKMDVSSAKSFVIDNKFLLRSLIYIKNKKDPKMEPCRTPAIIGNHVEG